MVPIPQVTERSKALFMKYAEDAGNWNGQPLVGGNVPDTKEDRGNLTQLKRAGLITTDTDEGCIWLNFTPAGVKYARTLGFKMLNFDDEGDRI
jgi:hypothetical protein